MYRPSSDTTTCTNECYGTVTRVGSKPDSSTALTRQRPGGAGYYFLGLLLMLVVLFGLLCLAFRQVDEMLMPVI